MRPTLLPAERAFQELLSAGGDLPALRRVYSDYSVNDDTWRFIAEFTDDRRASWVVHRELIEHEQLRDRWVDTYKNDCRSLWSCMVEDHHVWAETRRARDEYEQALREFRSQHDIELRYARLSQLEVNARRNHSSYDVPMGIYTGAVRRKQDKEAETRAEKLLVNWLSPEQKSEYANNKSFTVIGGTSGKRYRINHGRQMNIDELDEASQKVYGWCFLPEGQLAVGDVMLGQKVALEGDEAGALKKANKIHLAGHNPNWHANQLVPAVSEAHVARDF